MSPIDGEKSLVFLYQTTRDLSICLQIVHFFLFIPRNSKACPVFKWLYWLNPTVSLRVSPRNVLSTRTIPSDTLLNICVCVFVPYTIRFYTCYQYHTLDCLSFHLVLLISICARHTKLTIAIVVCAEKKYLFAITDIWTGKSSNCEARR